MVFQKKPIEIKDTEENGVQHNGVESHETHSKKISFKKLHFPKIVALAGVFFVLFFVMGVYGFVQGLSIEFPKQVIGGIANVFGQELQKDPNGHTNILILGTGGAGHEGSDLTDSIIIASLDHESQSVAMLSIPRDLYVELPGVGGMKINAVYDTALRRNQRTGSSTTMEDDSLVIHESGESIGVLQETVERIAGVDIQYFMKVDFQGFVEIVDLVGGIDVDVPSNFVDRLYPTEVGYGYTTFFLRKGLQTLDGKTALKYARSRHSTSDFDRSKRQQVILKALLDKVLQQNVLTDTTKLKRMYYAVSQNLQTDLSLREIIRVASFAKDVKKEQIVNTVLHDDATKMGGFLYTPSRELFNGMSVLLPDGGTVYNPDYYKHIQLFAHIFLYSPEFFANPPRVKVLNGTNINGRRVSGVASTISYHLARYGVNVTEIGNAPKGEDYDTTTYFYSDDNVGNLQVPNVEIFIPGSKEKIADNTENAMFENVSAEIGEDNVDIVLIIGNDYKTYMPKY